MTTPTPKCESEWPPDKFPPNKRRDELAEKYCVGNTDGEPYSEYEGHFYKAGWEESKSEHEATLRERDEQDAKFLIEKYAELDAKDAQLAALRAENTELKNTCDSWEGLCSRQLSELCTLREALAQDAKGTG